MKKKAESRAITGKFCNQNEVKHFVNTAQLETFYMKSITICLCKTINIKNCLPVQRKVKQITYFSWMHAVNNFLCETMTCIITCIMLVMAIFIFYLSLTYGCVKVAMTCSSTAINYVLAWNIFKVKITNLQGKY